MEALLTAALLGWAPLADIVGDGVHWDRAPQGASFPCVVVTDVTTLYSHTMQGRVGLTSSVVRIDGYGVTRLQSLSIRDALIALGDVMQAPPLALELRESRGGLDVGDTPPPDGVSASDLARQNLEFDVWHTPA